MEYATSADGTRIAYEREGDGPAVLPVGGAFNDRHTWDELAAALSPRGGLSVPACESEPLRCGRLG